MPTQQNSCIRKGQLGLVNSQHSSRNSTSCGIWDLLSTVTRHPTPDTRRCGGIPRIRVKLMKTSIHKDPNASASLWMKFQPVRVRILFYGHHKLNDQFPASVTARIKESFL